MSEKEAIGFIASMCVRMFGLLVLIAESVVTNSGGRKFVVKQRDWLLYKQDELEVLAMVDEAMKEVSDD